MRTCAQLASSTLPQFTIFCLGNGDIHSGWWLFLPQSNQDQPTLPPPVADVPTDQPDADRVIETLSPYDSRLCHVNDENEPSQAGTYVVIHGSSRQQSYIPMPLDFLQWRSGISVS